MTQPVNSNSSAQNSPTWKAVDAKVAEQTLNATAQKMFTQATSRRKAQESENKENEKR